MNKSEKSEIEKLGEKLQKKIWRENKANLTKDGRRTMSVVEMGRLLGLQRTESYYLANKHYFRLIQIRGHTRVDIESFEKWYDNQVRYQKVDGSPPGRELKRNSYSPHDIEEMLGICEQNVYELIRHENLPVITVDYRMRIPKEAFDYWYSHQNHYRNQADRARDALYEAQTLTMPEMARFLGVTRSKVYAILKDRKYKDQLEIVVIAGKKRVTKESFNRWYAAYKKELPEEERLVKQISVRKSGTDLYYTLDEISELCGVNKSTVSRWVRKGEFPARRVGQCINIPRLEFDAWYEKYKQKQKRRK